MKRNQEIKYRGQKKQSQRLVKMFLILFPASVHIQKENTRFLCEAFFSTIGQPSMSITQCSMDHLINPAIQGQAPAYIADIPPEPDPTDTRKCLIILGHGPEVSPPILCYGINLRTIRIIICSLLAM